jgi:predicted regulator of Ras-like GTPase activity (Roadblock/LC7/MglB family)
MKSLINQNLNTELEKLEIFEDLIGSAIVNRNGLLTSSRLPRNVDSRRLGAMAATMFGAIESASLTLGKKDVENLIVEFNNYQVIVMGINEKLLLVSLLEKNTNIGLIFIELEEVIKNIKNIL